MVPGLKRLASVDIGTNRLVVRAHARDNSRSVDSAARSVSEHGWT